MMQGKRPSTGFIVSLSVLGVISFAGLLAWTQQQAIYDWWRLKDYKPPISIAKIAKTTTMTDEGKRLFYVYHPKIEPSKSFNEHCRKDNEFTIVLGCYVSNDGIYIFQVDDKRLDGIEEVTAVHELLHAVYHRLDASEKASIDKLTKRAYLSISNTRLKKTIAQYKKDDPASVPNELHSILGSEFRNLPGELEDHYRKYLSDRNVVVSLSEKYESAFEERENRIKQLGANLQSMRVTINQSNADLKARGEALKAEYSRLQSMQNTASPDEFRQEANAYNAAVEQYNADVATTTALIREYNELLKTYNHLVLEKQELYKAIDSEPELIN
jgi:hypothetical protein